MAFDLQVAELTRSTLLPLLAEAEVLKEIRMFGGLCLTVDTRMVAGVLDDRVLIRIPTDVYARELALGRVSPMDFTGKPLKNFAFLDRNLGAGPEALRGHLEISLAYVRAEGPKRPPRRHRPA